MRCRRRAYVLFTVTFVYSCVITIISIKMVEFSKNVTPDNILNNWHRNVTVSHRLHPESLHNSECDYSSITVHNGTFRPSFYTGNEKYTSVTSIDVYNEFEYESFKIKEPLFPRDIDKELFYKFGTGTQLLQPVPYTKLRGVVEVIRNGSFRNNMQCGWSGNYAPMHNTYSGTVSYFDKLCPLLSPEAKSFQHFIDGLLPKVIQVRDLLLHPNMKLLIANPRPSDKKMIMDILNRIGISQRQIVWYNGGTYTADIMVAACITPPLHPVLWRTARALVGAAEKPPVPQDEALVILLTRAFSHNGGRKLLNIQEVVKVLEERYGKERVVVFKGGFSLNESLDLFGKAHLIIGVHGGAFYNLNFARHTTKILEIMPYSDTGYPRGLATTIFWSMANLIGQEYWRLFVKTTGVLNNIILDLKLLNETLSKLDSVQPV